MKIVIAGASGFIGRKLISALLSDDKIESIVCLSRSFKKSDQSKITWKKADLMSLEDVILVTENCTHAIYLVHSMSPQARLSQGHFEDFDLYQADNFARACKKNNIQSIFYLGGLAPKEDAHDSKNWSRHLQSRIEVEKVLAGYGANVTVFRAGLILGSGGSSSEMMLNLVKRLPLMIAPSWTKTLSEPIDVSDVIYGMKEVLNHKELQGFSWDLSANEKMSYQELMLLASETLGLKRKILPVPFVSPKISQLWVSVVSGSTRALVYPLIESLIHPMLTRPDHHLFTKLNYKPLSIEKSLSKVCYNDKEISRLNVNFLIKTFDSKVNSIQRFNFKSNSSHLFQQSISRLYFNWLPKLLIGILKVHLNPEKNEVQFRLRFTKIDLLILRKVELSDDSIEKLMIEGGALKKKNSDGFLEFRKVVSTSSILFNVQDFSPRLPWFIYRSTQALIHLWVMNQFGAYLLKKFDPKKS